MASILVWMGWSCGVELSNDGSLVREWIKGLFDGDGTIAVLQLALEGAWANQKASVEVIAWLKPRGHL